MTPLVAAIALLCLSNIFMTFAWYGHLRLLADRPWLMVALISWVSLCLNTCFRYRRIVSAIR